MTPSAPTAIAALVSGRTRSRRPPECDGSTMTGRCDSRWATGHGADVERVAGRGLERPDAALAEHDVEVAALRDVLGRHQPLLDGGVHAALEQDRLAGRADGLEQREVLHVAGADLKHVGVRADQVDARRVDDLGDDRQADLRPDLGQDLQAGLAESLERVRRGPRLERAAAEQARRRPALAISAAASVCSGVSTLQGPAISVTLTGPIGTPPTQMTDRSL